MKKLLFSLALCFMITVSALAVVKTPDLIGGWRFEGDAKDCSGNGHDGVLRGDIDYGYALQFNGSSDYAYMSGTSALDYSGGITVSCWWRADSSFVNQWSTIISQYRQSQTGWSIEFNPGYTPAYFYFYVQQGGNAFIANFDPTGIIDPGTWYLVTATYDPTTGYAKIYINDQLMNTSAYTPGYDVSTSWNVYLGAREDFSTTLFPESIDEPLIWNRELSITEIQTLYNSGAGIKGDIAQSPWDTGLVGGWHLDEGAGTSFDDFCSSPHDGTNSGADWITGRVPVSGGTVPLAEGKFGKSYSFNGTSQYISVEASPSLDITGAFTLGAWIKMGASNSMTQVLGKWDDSGDYRTYCLGIVSNKLSLLVCSDGGATNYDILQGSTTLDPDEWYYIMGTYDGSHMKVYLNGVENGAKDTSISSIYINDKPFYIGGGYFGGSLTYFNGIIDEPRIYNRCLDQSEIRSLMLSFEPKEF